MKVYSAKRRNWTSKFVRDKKEKTSQNHVTPKEALKEARLKRSEKEQEICKTSNNKEKKKIIAFYDSLLKTQEKETLIKSHVRLFKKQFRKLKKNILQIEDKIDLNEDKKADRKIIRELKKDFLNERKAIEKDIAELKIDLIGQIGRAHV